MIMKLNPFKLFVIILSGILISSCVNEEYDLEKEMDNEITILKNLTVPVGDLGMMKLEELISLDDDELLRTTQDGDYYLHFAGDTYEETFSLGNLEISSEDFSTEPIIVHFPSFTYQADKSYTYSELAGSQLNTQMVLEIDSDIPGVIEDIDRITCEIDAAVSFSINTGSFHIKPGFSLQFPEDFHFIKRDADDSRYTISDGNIVTIATDTKVSAGNALVLDMILDEISVPADAVKNGTLTLNEEIGVTGDFYVNTNDFPTSQSNIQIEITPSVNVCRISSVTAKVKINETLAGTTVDIPELPEFFSGSDVVLDFFNPQITLNVTNTLPVSFSMGASLVAHFAQSDIQLNPFGEDLNARLNVNAAAAGEYLISRRSAGNVGEAQNIVHPQIGNILNTIPESIGIENISVRSETDGFVTVDLSDEYKMILGYNVNVPLAFDKETAIAFSYDIESLDLVFDAKISAATLNLDMVNSIPLDFKVDAECLDADGNVSQVLNVTVDGDLSAGSHQSPTDNHVKIELKNNEETFELNGLRLKLSAKASETYIGTSLNKDQGLEIKNISMSLPDGFTIDLGDTSEE